MAKYIPVEGIKTFIRQNGFVYANTLDSFPGVDIVSAGTAYIASVTRLTPKVLKSARPPAWR